MSHSRCPPGEDGYGYLDKDKSSCYGRGARSCKTHVDTVRSGCTRVGSAHKRVEEVEITGIVTKDSILKGATHVYHGGGAVVRP